MKRKLVCSIFSVLLIVAVANVHAQTPGQIPVFDQPGTGACNNAGGNDCIDSVITQSGANIGIGTTTPAAKLDVVGGNVNLENSTATSGNILKGGTPFLHNYGNSNTFLGLNAGNFTMMGAQNTAIGLGALYNNTTGYGNTASGYQALYNDTTGYGNTASGYQALYSNTTASGNTASGSLALYSNTTASGNTASGSGALYNTTAGGNTAIGLGALYNNTTGAYNTASGYEALHNNTTGQYNTAIGYLADACEGCGNLSNATAIGAGAIVDASNKIRLGNAGVAVIEGQVPYTFTSDRNKKENFRPVDGEEVLRKISGLSLTSWNYIGHDPEQFRHYGPVAQDFFAAFGHDGVGTVGTPTTLNSGDVEGILMIAVQALSRDNDAFKAENAELKARIAALERSVEKSLK